MTAQANVTNTTGDQRPSTAAHTPGPWFAIHEPAREIAEVWDNGGYRIDADGVEQLAFVWVLNHRIPADGGPQTDGPMFGAVQTGANARLIAAAPDMLAALTRIAELCDDDNGAHWLTKNDTTRALARAAIAKATGAA